MKLYSYVVARDFGFAPNPFWGTCSLATCKPMIRKNAEVDDWVVGTGSRRYSMDGHIIYAMKVNEVRTFEEYWVDKLFSQKRPNLHASLKQAFGDNIYHRNPNNNHWIQENSHHSLPDGRPNVENLRHDTQVNRVLLGTEFVYWGATGIRIPSRYRHYAGHDICTVYQGHKSNFPTDLVELFVKWIESQGLKGYIGQPCEFPT